LKLSFEKYLTMSVVGPIGEKEREIIYHIKEERKRRGE